MPWTEPRIYTFLPREGTSKRRTLREALYIKRNAVEGIFSQVKGSGVGGDDQWRAFWAKDFETEHLLGARLAYLTATRLISSNGLYDEVAAEADSWGWPDGRFGEGPVDLHTDEHETRLACRTAQEPRPPASWIRDRGESGYSHEHLQLSRARRRKEQGCHDIAVAA